MLPKSGVLGLTEGATSANSPPITSPMPPRLLAPQDKGRAFRESFLTKLALLLRGTVAAPADRFGETLADEHLRGGEEDGGRGAVSLYA
jgi:hypothetical protein